MKSHFVITLLLVALAGCSSSTKLAPEVVTPKVAAPSQPETTSQVTPVVIDQSKATTEGPKQTAHVVYFDYDSYTIKDDAKMIIERHAQYLRGNPQRKLQLEGHTDSRGGREYNLALGNKRAETVQRALTLLGASSTQIESISYGKEKPAVPQESEAAWAKNRRVEFIYR